MRKHLSGWVSHASDINKKEKAGLSSIIDDLEALAEIRPLSTKEIELKSQSNARLVYFGRRFEYMIFLWHYQWQT
jgi:hypothetical protein